MKLKIVKVPAQGWYWELKEKGYKDGDKLILSIPRRKGVRHLLKGIFRVYVPTCGCCGPTYCFETSNPTKYLRSY